MAVPPESASTATKMCRGKQILYAARVRYIPKEKGDDGIDHYSKQTGPRKRSLVKGVLCYVSKRKLCIPGTKISSNSTAVRSLFCRLAFWAK